MSRLIAGAGMAAFAAALIDTVGDFPAPPRPGEGHKRAKARLAENAVSSNYGPGQKPLPETRQQRRARERQEAKKVAQ